MVKAERGEHVITLSVLLSSILLFPCAAPLLSRLAAREEPGHEAWYYRLSLPAVWEDLMAHVPRHPAFTDSLSLSQAWVGKEGRGQEEKRRRE